MHNICFKREKKGVGSQRDFSNCNAVAERICVKFVFQFTENYIGFEHHRCMCGCASTRVIVLPPRVKIRAYALIYDVTVPSATT